MHSSDDSESARGHLKLPGPPVDPKHANGSNARTWFARTAVVEGDEFEHSSTKFVQTTDFAHTELHQLLQGPNRDIGGAVAVEQTATLDLDSPLLSANRCAQMRNRAQRGRTERHVVQTKVDFVAFELQRLPDRVLFALDVRVVVCVGRDFSLINARSQQRIAKCSTNIPVRAAACSDWSQFGDKLSDLTSDPARSSTQTQRTTSREPGRMASAAVERHS